MRSPSRLLSVPVVLLLLCAPVVSGQSWLDKVKKKVEQKAGQRADQKTDEAIDKGLDSAENAIKCAATDTACIDKAQKNGKKVVLVDEAGEPAAGRSADGRSAGRRSARRSRPRGRHRPAPSGRCRGSGPTSTSSPATA